MKRLTQIVSMVVILLFVITGVATELSAPGTGAQTVEAVQAVVQPVTSAVIEKKSVWQTIWDNRDIVLLALLSISEVLALIPSIKQSSIFELVVSFIKTLTGKKGEFSKPT